MVHNLFTKKLKFNYIKHSWKCNLAIVLFFLKIVWGSFSNYVVLMIKNTFRHQIILLQIVNIKKNIQNFNDIMPLQSSIYGHP
jgi:hypothetical protein